MKSLKKSQCTLALLMLITLGSFQSAIANPNLTPGTWTNISPPGQNIALGVAMSPANPSILYLNCSMGGMFKSTNGGTSWTGSIGTAFYDNDGVTRAGNPWGPGTGGCTGQGRSWTVTADPTDANTVYAFSAFNCLQGPWKTTDGGNTWRYLLNSADVRAASADIYAIAVSQLNHLHVLMTFHSPFQGIGGGDAGITESTDGGNTWILHKPLSQGGVMPNTGAGQYAFFLEEKNDRSPDPEGKFWIFATQANGYWRTEDGGLSWTRIANGYVMQHGACGIYRASTGFLYMGALSHLLRSTDNGRTWADAGALSNSDGYNTVIGDGTTMYVMPANTGTSTTGLKPFYVSSETDGTHWTAYNTQTFADGPGWAVTDRVNHIVYASLWDHGLWALKATNTSVTGVSEKAQAKPRASSSGKSGLMIAGPAGMKKLQGSGYYDIRGRAVSQTGLHTMSVYCSDFARQH